MSSRVAIHIILAFVLTLFAMDSHAARRSLRIDFIAWENDPENTIGSFGCPGTTAGSVLLEWNGFTFSGLNDSAHLTDAYCQAAIEYFESASTEEYLNGEIFVGISDPEPGLATLIGANTDNSVTAIRYAFLDDDRFESPQGFQWVFYFFPGNITIVGLYGLIGVELTDTSFISKGSNFMWQGDADGFDGEYFCFKKQTFVGTWDGETVGDDPAGACPFIFANGFESN
jgi:hypothetical protein